MKINPVLENEIKRNMRSAKSSWVILMGNLILLMVVVVMYLGTGIEKQYMMAGQYRFPVECYMVMAFVLFGMICLLVPGIAGGSIAIERERKTLDILLTTHLSPWRIIVGKLEASLCMIFILAISSLPVVSLILVYGGISILDLLALVGILIVSGIFVGSIGVFCSAVCKKTTVAMILSYVIVLALALGTAAAVVILHSVMDIRGQQMDVYQTADVGGWIYLLYLNPLVSYFGLLSQQVGSGYELVKICGYYGDYSHQVGVHHMLPIAIVVQLLISAVLLVIAGKRINPLK